MEILNTIPPFPIMNMFMALMGRVLLAIGLYYMGKGLWLTLRRRNVG